MCFGVILVPLSRSCCSHDATHLNSPIQADLQEGDADDLLVFVDIFLA